MLPSPNSIMSLSFFAILFNCLSSVSDLLSLSSKWQSFCICPPPPTHTFPTSHFPSSLLFLLSLSSPLLMHPVSSSPFSLNILISSFMLLYPCFVLHAPKTTFTSISDSLACLSRWYHPSWFLWIIFHTSLHNPPESFPVLFLLYNTLSLCSSNAICSLSYNACLTLFRTVLFI